MPNSIYQVADFKLDTHTRRFYCRQNEVQLSSRAFDILEFLVENRGRIVEKSELIERVWSDSFVEEGNLAVHISALRRVLGEKRGESRYIKTISGRGYSFIAPVRQFDATGKSNQTEKKSYDLPVNENHSIAVLPFTFQDGIEDFEYLANGITQSLIDDLSHFPALKVLAYSAVRQYRGENPDFNEIGFLLGANKILTGHLSNHKGRLEISAELINAQDKTHVWGTQQFFNQDNIFTIKGEISLSIAEKLKLKLDEINKQNISGGQKLNPEAQKLYFRGMTVLESRTMQNNIAQTLAQALGFFQQAVKIEPNYALAYTGIGMTYVSLYNHCLCERDRAYIEVQRAISTALHADEQTSQAHVLKGSFETMFDRNFVESDKSLDRAVELQPNNPDAYHWQAMNCMILGKFKEALALETKATQLDPVSTRFNGQLMRIHFFAGDYQKAIVQAEELIEFNRNIVDPHLFLATSYAELYFFNQSLEFIDRAIELRSTAELFLFKSYILALSGDHAGARKIIPEVLDGFPALQIDEIDLAAVYATLGETAAAFEMLEKAIRENSSGLIGLKINPRLKNLRNDPRFESIIRRLNLI